MVNPSHLAQSIDMRGWRGSRIPRSGHYRRAVDTLTVSERFVKPHVRRCAGCIAGSVLYSAFAGRSLILSSSTSLCGLDGERRREVDTVGSEVGAGALLEPGAGNRVRSDNGSACADAWVTSVEQPLESPELNRAEWDTGRDGVATGGMLCGALAVENVAIVGGLA